MGSIHLQLCLTLSSLSLSLPLCLFLSFSHETGPHVALAGLELSLAEKALKSLIFWTHFPSAGIIVSITTTGLFCLIDFPESHCVT